MLVSTGLTVNTKVATESHPVTLTSVSVYVPAAVYVLPFRLYGNRFEQTIISVVLPATGLTFRTSVATESQPNALFNVSVYVPAAAYVLLFELYGS